MKDPNIEYVYEPFAQTEEYLSVNTAIVRRWARAVGKAGNKQLERIVDLASGVGTMSQLLLETLPSAFKPAEVVCVDISSQALDQASRNLRGRVQNLRMIQAPLQEVALEPESVDAAVWGNGVHYLNPEEQRIAFMNIRNALRNGGWFFLNSAFHEESRPPKTLAFYRAQVGTAVRNLRLRGFSRDRSESSPESALFLPLSHYRALLLETGFQVVEVRNVVARLYRSAWEKISAFSQYAAGALHGYPPEAAVEALQAAVAPSLAQYGMRDENDDLYIPRNWFCAIARKT